MRERMIRRKKVGRKMLLSFFVVVCVLMVAPRSDPPRKVKSTPHISDEKIASKSDGSLLTSNGVSFADPSVRGAEKRFVVLFHSRVQRDHLSSSGSGGSSSPDFLRSRSKTMSASGSPVSNRTTLKVGEKAEKDFFAHNSFSKGECGFAFVSALSQKQRSAQS